MFGLTKILSLEKLFEDKNLYLCYSPLEFEEKNNERIDKIIDDKLMIGKD